ncbi:hypothetical protein C8Q78DRAFT_170538 [Trametes maxima]|nr:hypothetical protein C8Q78DRAFT_170538 [Trametes maxima]
MCCCNTPRQSSRALFATHTHHPDLPLLCACGALGLCIRDRVSYVVGQSFARTTTTLSTPNWGCGGPTIVAFPESLESSHDPDLSLREIGRVRLARELFELDHETSPDVEHRAPPLGLSSPPRRARRMGPKWTSQTYRTNVPVPERDNAWRIHSAQRGPYDDIWALNIEHRAGTGRQRFSVRHARAREARTGALGGRTRSFKNAHVHSTRPHPDPPPSTPRAYACVPEARPRKCVRPRLECRSGSAASDSRRHRCACVCVCA